MSENLSVSAAEQRSFLADLIRFVEEEAEAQRQALEELRRLSIAERVAKGRAIMGLAESGEVGPKTVRLTCPANDARFRAGDMVCLSTGDPRVDRIARGTLAAVEDTYVDLALMNGRVEPGSVGLVLDEDSIDLTGTYKKAIERAATSVRGQQQIIPLLLRQITPTGPSAQELMAIPALVREGFTPRQAEAIVFATSTDLAHLIQGPPGTGKTRVLARIVQRLQEQNPRTRILVTSFTHRAIDNALEEMLQHGCARSRLAKIAQTPPDSALPWYLSFRDTPWAAGDAGGYVIGATPFALQSRLDGVEFDWVIVDEASQVTLPLAVMAMLGGERWIFAGDHKQMPPVTLTRTPEQAIEESVFGRLQAGGFSTMLDTTYRMNDRLTAWPSTAFYRDELKPGAATGRRRLQLPCLPAGFEDVFDPAQPSIFLRLRHWGEKVSSPLEVQWLAAMICALDAVGFPLREVGVVVPYRRQARLLRNELGRRGLSPEKRRDLVADTVERIQGQGREIIMVSLTTSDVAFANLLGEFLFQPERLNVAITRCKTKLIVLGSAAWLEDFPRGIAPDFGFARFESFLRSCRIVDR